MTWKEFNEIGSSKANGALVNNYGFESEKDIEKAGFRYHHCATRKGYQSRKFKVVEDYAGKFGVGYIVRENNINSNRYGIKISYFVK